MNKSKFNRIAIAAILSASCIASIPVSVYAESSFIFPKVSTEISSPVTTEEAEETIPAVSIVEKAKENLELSHDICQTMHIKEDGCKLYDYPSEILGQVVLTLDKNERVFEVGTSIDGFHSIEYNDKVYYVKETDLYEFKSSLFTSISTKMYLNATTNIFNFPENSQDIIMAKDVKVNTLLNITGEFEEFYRVYYEGNSGYIQKSYLSETKLEPKISEVQRKIVEIALTNGNGKLPCESGYCAAWVSKVYVSAGLYRDKTFGHAISYWNKWGNNDGVTSSTSPDNIPVGAVVVGSGRGTELGNKYGHVGIYLGGGMVAENNGYHNITGLQEWIDSNVGICEGYQGFIGWVFPFNIDLQDY